MNPPNFKGFFAKIWFLWAICLIFNIITFLIIFIKIDPGNKPLALHYNVLTGVEWYGKGKNLYFVPGAGLAICAVNFLLYAFLKRAKSFFNFLVIFATLCVQLILLFAAILLARVN